MSRKEKRVEMIIENKALVRNYMLMLMDVSTVVQKLIQNKQKSATAILVVALLIYPFLLSN